MIFAGGIMPTKESKDILFRKRTKTISRHLW